MDIQYPSVHKLTGNFSNQDILIIKYMLVTKCPSSGIPLRYILLQQVSPLQGSKCAYTVQNTLSYILHIRDYEELGFLTKNNTQNQYLLNIL